MNGMERLPEPHQGSPGDTQLDSKLRVGPAWTLKPTYYFKVRGFGLREELLLPRLSTAAAEGESIMFDHKNIQPQSDGLSPANTPTVMDRWEWRPHLHVKWEIEPSECERQLAPHPHKHMSPFCPCSNHVRAFLMRVSTRSGSVWAVRVLRKWMKSKREGAAPDSADDICHRFTECAAQPSHVSMALPRKSLLDDRLHFSFKTKVSLRWRRAQVSERQRRLFEPFSPSSPGKNCISWKWFPVLRLTLNVYGPRGGS